MPLSGGSAMRVCALSSTLIAAALFAADHATAQDSKDPSWWPQFRGPNAAGVASDGKKLPTEFGPEKFVLWKTPLPAGLSSPCIWDKRIFLTAYDKETKKLETICLDRGDGRILWR